MEKEFDIKQGLNLPQHPLRLQKDGDKEFVFDPIRNKYLLLTPEEWVRQNFIQFLIMDMGFAAGLMTVEKEFKLNELKKRADIVVHNQYGSPILIVECKTPKSKIGQSTFEQIARYNLVYKVPYLVVTNGITHYCAQINHEKRTFEFLTDIPRFEDIKNL